MDNKQNPGCGLQCRCPRRIHRFIEPCLLLALRRAPSYGYQLLEELAKSGFHEDSPDAAAIYRNLRRLEDENFVESRWEPGESGPAKRIYKITPLGCRLLAEWASAMEAQRSALDNFLSVYQAEFSRRDSSP